LKINDSENTNLEVILFLENTNLGVIVFLENTNLRVVVLRIIDFQ